MNYDATLFERVNDFITNTEMLTSLLESDVEQFKKNEVLLIEESNIKRKAAHTKLHEIVNGLQSMPVLAAYDGSLYGRLLKYANSLPLASRERMDTLLLRMNEVVMRHNQLMLVNRQIINANLTYIKDLVFALVNNKSHEKSQNTYDKLGHLEKS